MAKQRTLEAMGTLHVSEEHREDFIRVLKYGLMHARPALHQDLRDVLSAWIDQEERSIDKFEGRIPEGEDE